VLTPQTVGLIGALIPDPLIWRPLRAGSARVETSPTDGLGSAPQLRQLQSPKPRPPVAGGFDESSSRFNHASLFERELENGKPRSLHEIVVHEIVVHEIVVHEIVVHEIVILIKTAIRTNKRGE